MTTRRSRGRSTGVLAVALTATLLSALIVVQRLGGRVSETLPWLHRASIDAVVASGSEEYFASVRAAIELIPYRIGDYIGDDAPPTPAAIKLLRPNKILQRRYVDPATGRHVSLLIVHCGDVRDMQGHYPPVCYPAHGWKMESAERATAPLGGQAMPAMSYLFSRSDKGLTQQMRILNFFVLPDGRVLADDADLDKVSKSRAGAGLGSAQVQLVFSESIDASEQAALVERFARAVEPVVRAVVRRNGDG